MTASVRLGAVSDLKALVNRVAAEGHHRGRLTVDIDYRKGGVAGSIAQKFQISPYSRSQIPVVEVPLSGNAWIGRVRVTRKGQYDQQGEYKRAGSFHNQ